MTDKKVDPLNLITSRQGPLSALEELLIDRADEIESWFGEAWEKTPLPLYASVDIRDAGFKIAPVDTNLFPAGFNNLHPQLKGRAVSAFKKLIENKAPKTRDILLIPESHSRNLAYFDNLAVLVDIITAAGFSLSLGLLDCDLKEPVERVLEGGRVLKMELLEREGSNLRVVGGVKPDLIILNNDCSSGTPELLQGIRQKVLPPFELGWVDRLKSEHFRYYQQVVQEFSQVVDCDPWLLMPLFNQCPEVDFMQRQGSECLHAHAKTIWHKIEEKYKTYHIQDDPYLVVKADQGTYGMAVMMIYHPDELLTLNRKARTSMSTLKGGREVTRAIIQEGVPSIEVMADDAVAEPVIYLIGSEVIGGFYRVHGKKDSRQNLNAPGMTFFPMELNHQKDQPNRFYPLSVIARLAALAAARELAVLTSESSA